MFSLRLGILLTHLASVIYATTDKSCLSGFDKVGERCMKLVTDKKTYLAAKENCQNLGARLATPSSGELFEQLIKWDKMASRRKRKVWIGLSKSPYYFWADGTRFNETLEYFQKNKIRGIPGKRKDCVFAKVKDPKLRAVWCGKKFASVCEIPLEEAATQVLTKSTTQAPTESTKQKTYIFYKDIRTHLEARRACQALEGQLAMPKTDAEYQNMINACEKISCGAIRWIGISRNVSGSGNEWSFGDGTSVGSWTKWAQNQPENILGTEECVLMVFPFIGNGYKTYQNGWNVQNCSQKFRYVCEFLIEVTWSDWSNCSVTCGGGQMTRTRSCPQSAHSDNCPGPDIESQKCNTEDCPPEWSTWSPYSRCSETCGGGQQTRDRKCSVAGECPGDRRESRDCNQAACPEWSTWSPYSQCSETCGAGHQTRDRKCPVAGECPGDGRETVACYQAICPEWSNWSPYSRCSETCGGGHQTRARECPVAGECPGDRRESRDCNQAACPVVVVTCNDCDVVDITCPASLVVKVEYARFGFIHGVDCPSGPAKECNVTKDVGEIISEKCDEKTRCKFWMTTGLLGDPCSGKTKHFKMEYTCYKSLKLNENKSKEYTPEAPEKCIPPKWSNWSPYTQCSETCGGGQQTRARKCSVAGECPGDRRESRGCNQAACPDRKVGFLCNPNALRCMPPSP